MSIKNIVKNEIDITEGYLSLMYDSLNYIEEYGYVGLYDYDMGDEDLRNKIKEINLKLDEAEKLLDKFTEIIKDQFGY